MSNEEALTELVLATGEQIAVNALNQGIPLEFLLNNGWTRADIFASLSEMVEEPDTLETFLGPGG